jgi:hypothetical protein
VVLLAGVLAVVGCTAHPVGPARSSSAYQGKAVTTAESALSSVETVRLAARTGGEGNAFGPYLSVTVSDQEEALSGVQGTFASIQPPGPSSDQLRAELDGLLSSSLDHIVDVRIALRRGQIERAAAVAEPLTADAAELEQFIEAHR